MYYFPSVHGQQPMMFAAAGQAPQGANGMVTYPAGSMIPMQAAGGSPGAASSAGGGGAMYPFAMPMPMGMGMGMAAVPAGMMAFPPGMVPVQLMQVPATNPAATDPPSSSAGGKKGASGSTSTQSKTAVGGPAGTSTPSSTPSPGASVPQMVMLPSMMPGASTPQGSGLQPGAAAVVAPASTTTAPGASLPSYEAVVMDPNGPRSQTNLFVRKLASAVTEADMLALFKPYGDIVSFALMRDIHTGDSLGTAFVRFETHEQANAAMQALDGRELYSRPISIQWAKRHHDGTPIGEARQKIHKVFVRNIPLEVTSKDLRALFEPFGTIANVTVHSDTVPQSSPGASSGPAAPPQRNIAFILFNDDGAAEKAVTTLHNTCPFDTCDGIPLMVKLAEDNRQRLERKQKLTVGAQKRGGGESDPALALQTGGAGLSARQSPEASSLLPASAPSHPLPTASTVALPPGAFPVPGGYMMPVAAPAAGQQPFYYPVAPAPAPTAATTTASPEASHSNLALGTSGAGAAFPQFLSYPQMCVPQAAQQPQYFVSVDMNGMPVGPPMMYAPVPVAPAPSSRQPLSATAEPFHVRSTTHSQQQLRERRAMEGGPEAGHRPSGLSEADSLMGTPQQSALAGRATAAGGQDSDGSPALSESSGRPAGAGGANPAQPFSLGLPLLMSASGPASSIPQHRSTATVATTVGDALFANATAVNTNSSRGGAEDGAGAAVKVPSLAPSRSFGGLPARTGSMPELPSSSFSSRGRAGTPGALLRPGNATSGTANTTITNTTSVAAAQPTPTLLETNSTDHSVAAHSRGEGCGSSSRAHSRRPPDMSEDDNEEEQLFANVGPNVDEEDDDEDVVAYTQGLLEHFGICGSGAASASQTLAHDAGRS